MTTLLETQSDHAGRTRHAADHHHGAAAEPDRRPAPWESQAPGSIDAVPDSGPSRFWVDLKMQDPSNIDRLKHFIPGHGGNDCF